MTEPKTGPLALDESQLQTLVFGQRSAHALARWPAVRRSRESTVTEFGEEQAAEALWSFGASGEIRLQKLGSGVQGQGTLGGAVFEASVLGALPQGTARLRIGPFPLPQGTDWALAHGWQCWSESPFVWRDGVLREDTRKERWVFGDPAFYPYAEQPGVLHSWFFSWCGSAAQPGAHGFFGAHGFKKFAAAFVFELAAGRVWVDVDVEGCTFGPQAGRESICRFQIPGHLSAGVALSDELHKWAYDLRNTIPQPPSPGASEAPLTGPRLSLPVRGYTSWYHHYFKIDLELLERNLAAAPQDMQVFQIDDGYQASIGEWTTLRPGFGTLAGMQGFLNRVRARGLVPGLWLAPFVVAEGCPLLAQRPHWLLRDENGDPIRVGHIPHWGGDFFALDTELPEFRTWLDEILRYWTERGVGFFKCDFLYAPGVTVARSGTVYGQAPGTLTRLQRACRAQQFLYERARHHGALLLSCGSILEQTIGTCDFARIGADVGQTWDDADETMRFSREKVSTRAALGNTVIRAALSGNGLWTDGDVSIVRSFDTELSFRERELLAWINGWASDVQFVSCDTFKWDPEAHRIYEVLREGLGNLGGSSERVLGRGAAVLGVWPLRHSGHAAGTAVEGAGSVSLLCVRLRVPSGAGHARVCDLTIDLARPSWGVTYRDDLHTSAPFGPA